MRLELNRGGTASVQREALCKVAVVVFFLDYSSWSEAPPPRF